MNIARRKQLAETSRTLTFEGVPCKIGGWANEYATVTSQIVLHGEEESMFFRRQNYYGAD